MAAQWPNTRFSQVASVMLNKINHDYAKAKGNLGSAALPSSGNIGITFSSQPPSSMVVKNLSWNELAGGNVSLSRAAQREWNILFKGEKLSALSPDMAREDRLRALQEWASARGVDNNNMQLPPSPPALSVLESAASSLAPIGAASGLGVLAVVASSLSVASAASAAAVPAVSFLAPAVLTAEQPPAALVPVATGAATSTLVLPSGTAALPAPEAGVIAAAALPGSSVSEEASLARSMRASAEAPPSPPAISTPPPKDWLPEFDFGLMKELGLLKLRDLLPQKSWLACAECGINDFSDVEQLWAGVVHTIAAATGTTPNNSKVDLCRLLQYHMVGLVDAQLLAAHLRTRPEVGDLLGDRNLVRGVTGGVWSLDSHDTIVGIMCKSGCIGEQVWKEPEKEKFISPFPQHISTQALAKVKMCKEAFLLSEAMGISEEGVECTYETIAELDEIEASAAYKQLQDSNKPALFALLLAVLLFLSKYNKDEPTYNSSWASLYAAWHMRRHKEDSYDAWHVERSSAHLLHKSPYMDSIPLGSLLTCEVGTFAKKLGFKVGQVSSPMDMVLWNHGKPRSIIAVARYQLLPAVMCGRIRLDTKFPYILAIITGAAGWLDPNVVDTATLRFHHPLGVEKAGFRDDSNAVSAHVCV